METSPMDKAWIGAKVRQSIQNFWEERDPFEINDWWRGSFKGVEDIDYDLYRHLVEGRKMNLLEKYDEYFGHQDVQRGVELKALDANGRLTDEGQKLLIRLFYDNEIVRKEFFNIIRKLDEVK